ncbi:Os11g0419425 [Oryza sativa Japonica Group]|uniref:Os11g0419425 protein n=1 Tax=Oryza sativa subsp. japonica TaxID=39947 RepID=A0A0P0Y1H0_ORYSJ|nr:Os11g0419425 [Oryza sativa Japonica Group]
MRPYAQVNITTFGELVSLLVAEAEDEARASPTPARRRPPLVAARPAAASRPPAALAASALARRHPQLIVACPAAASCPQACSASTSTAGHPSYRRPPGGQVAPRSTARRLGIGKPLSVTRARSVSVLGPALLPHPCLQHGDVLRR